MALEGRRGTEKPASRPRSKSERRGAWVSRAEGSRRKGVQSPVAPRGVQTCCEEDRRRRLGRYVPDTRWLVPLLVTACVADVSLGDVPGVGTDPEDLDSIPMVLDGERLASIVARSADGTELWLGWFDRSLGMECTSAPDIADRLRCLPAQELKARALDLYGDSDCSMPLVEPPDEGNDAIGPVLFMQQEITGADGVDGRWLVYRYHAPHAGAVFRREDGDCRDATWNGPLPWSLQPVDTGVFVDMDRAMVDGGDRIVPQVERGADGALRIVGARDIELEINVEAGVASDGTLRWLPAPGEAEELVIFADGKCSAPLAFRDERMGYTKGQDGCEAAIEVYRVTSTVTSPHAIWSIHDGECLRVSVDSGLNLYNTLPLSADTFVAADIVVEQKTERLQTTAWGVGRQPLAHHSRWLRDNPSVRARHFDRELEIACDFVVDAQGDHRCLPPFVVPEALYADPNCREPLVSRPACDEVRHAAQLDSSGAVRSFHQIGPELEGPVHAFYFERCVPLDWSSSTYQILGPEISLSGFVAAETTVTER